MFRTRDVSITLDHTRTPPFLLVVTRLVIKAGGSVAHSTKTCHFREPHIVVGSAQGQLGFRDRTNERTNLSSITTSSTHVMEGPVIGLLALFIIITACAYRNKCCCFQSNPHLFPVTAMQVPTIVQQPAVVSGAAMQVPTFVIQRQPIVAGRHENTIRTARGILRGLSAVQDLDL